MSLFKIICFVILLLPVAEALAVNESQTDRSIEAQRYYDLAVSYIKSDLYGLAGAFERKPTVSSCF